MKTLSPNTRPELKPVGRSLGPPPGAVAGLLSRQVDEIAICVQCNGTTYLLSLEARHTLKAEEGKNKQTNRVLPREWQQWSPGKTDVKDSQDPASRACTVHSGCIMWVFNTCLIEGGGYIVLERPSNCRGVSLGNRG